MNNSAMISSNKRLIGILIFVAIILLVPLIAMQFTSEVQWEYNDFITMGVLLLFTGLSCELIMRKVRQLKYRLLLILGVLTMFFVIWVELAVGVFGTPFAGS